MGGAYKIEVTGGNGEDCKVNLDGMGYNLIYGMSCAIKSLARANNTTVERVITAIYTVIQDGAVEESEG